MAAVDRVKLLSVIDDSGLLAIADAMRYAPFVGEGWTYEQILDHFAKSMAAKTLLVWECGDGGDEYLVSVRHGFTPEPGFREIIGSIEAPAGQLHLVSYTALTMAAQFEDQGIPSKEEADLSFAVPTGSVRIRVVQMFDPSSLDRPTARQPHFIVEVESGNAPAWPGVAWEAARAS